MALSSVRNLQDFIDWAYAIYLDLSDRLSDLENAKASGQTIKYPLVLKIGQAIRSANYNSFGAGAGITIEGNGTLASRSSTVLAGRTTFYGVADFTKATVLGLPTGTGGGGGGSTEVVFSHPGILSSASSTPWTPRASITTATATVLFGTAGTGGSTIRLRKNGTNVATFTVGAGVSVANFTPVVAIAPGDRMTIIATTAGAGAVDMTVILRW